ncbi:MAG TPA: glycogen debranching N-terminal domain-containing protein [Thermoanaerobaculia bacterium]|nr:glycogen debranching N-terminal domain-containing protein [Thermoanaerobaculia bacterium]
MQELEPAHEKFYIQAVVPRGDERTRVLKDGESFGVFDRGGTVPDGGRGELGLFHEGTRYLSRFELLCAEQQPLLLSSTSDRDNALVTHLTNPDLAAGGKIVLPRGTLHMLGSAVLWQGAYYLRVRVRNYGMAPLDLRLTLLFAADYADLFEVRGTPRRRRGRMLEPIVGKGSVLLGYLGLDGRVRRTRLTFSPLPAELSASHAFISKSLGPHEEQVFYVSVSFESNDEAPALLTFGDALRRSSAQLKRRGNHEVAVSGSNQELNEWVFRSASDLQLMITDTPSGPYPYAGIPWFSTVFGRDGIITALETLWQYPDLARGVLAFLAATQAREDDPEHDAEPGKIVHEMRHGEMAALGEVPFGSYYGSVDATPLFVMLAGAYWERTGDRDFLASIWPNVESALAWIDEHGDLDGDGFVEYARRSSNGLSSQGWKDSGDSISHRDGTLAEGPIALCEVQAYVYAARLRAAAVAAALGHAERSAELARQAERLRGQFEDSFWLEDISTYALALDGDKRPCAVRASNAGHCLFAGIAAPERARRVAATLLSEGSFSGWGIRTLDAGEARYNPMSYHNGSVWPHDNALIAAGFSRYGMVAESTRVLAAIGDACAFFDLRRMPELFCGFPRRSHEGPILYPVACAPQAWAAAAVFLLLQAAMGLAIDAPRGQIRFDSPELPKTLKSLTIRGLKVGGARLDLTLQRHTRDIGIVLDRKEGDVEVVVVK